MSWGFLGKVGGAIKKGVEDVGKVAEKAAPYVGLIPGVGTVAGGVIGGLGGLAAGDGLSGALKYGAEGAGGALLSGALGGASGIASKLGSGATSVASLLKEGGGALVGDAAQFLKGNGGANALGLAQGVNSVLQQNKANGYANDALKTVNDSYNARAPLRAQGIAQLLNPTTPSLVGLNRTRTVGSPYGAVNPSATADPFASAA